MLYPLKLEPIHKPRIWGGQTLAELFGFQFSQDQRIGEVWAVADYPPDTSKIANGHHAGKTLGQILKQYPLELTACSEFREFPWLIKFLDATDRLSIQVHPDDILASRYSGERGKAEMWYVLKAGPEAEIIYGLKPGVDRQVFKRALQEEDILKCLNTIKVKAGDIYYIPPGMIHALGRDVVVAEVQQNSDTTYRIFDYNRLDDSGHPRELHVEKALEAIDFSLQPVRVQFPAPLESRHFRVDFLDTTAKPFLALPDKEFQALLILTGQGVILFDTEELPVQSGNAVIIPAQLNRVQIRGELQALRSRLGTNVTARRNNRREFGPHNRGL